MRRAAAALSVFLLAGGSAAAQGKVWEQNKPLLCTITLAHICAEQSCESKQTTAEFRLDLAAKSACILNNGQCTETEAIGATKEIGRVLLIYTGMEKADPSVIRLWDDGRFTVLGMREMSGEGAGEGGYVMLGKCAAQ
ncbi:MAG: hypothetical protein KIT16_23600 [Rhodospirillaceae bacterium]|nr:hypothetical protein [Rhodospirillaceae bacterium]